MFKRVKIKANGQEVSAEGVGCLRGDHVEKRGERRVLTKRKPLTAEGKGTLLSVEGTIGEQLGPQVSSG